MVSPAPPHDFSTERGSRRGTTEVRAQGEGGEDELRKGDIDVGHGGERGGAVRRESSLHREGNAEATLRDGLAIGDRGVENSPSSLQPDARISRSFSGYSGYSGLFGFIRVYLGVLGL